MAVPFRFTFARRVPAIAVMKDDRFRRAVKANRGVLTTDASQRDAEGDAAGDKALTVRATRVGYGGSVVVGGSVSGRVSEFGTGASSEDLQLLAL